MERSLRPARLDRQYAMLELIIVSRGSGSLPKGTPAIYVNLI